MLFTVLCHWTFEDDDNDANDEEDDDINDDETDNIC